MLKDSGGNPAGQIDFKEWLCDSVLMDARFGKTFQDLTLAEDLKKKIEKSNGEIEFSDMEWRALIAAINEPTGGYNPRMALQLMPFMRLMLEAKRDND